MKNKVLISIITLFLILIFSISYSFASTNMVQDAVEGIRNVVGGAENVVENAGSGVINGVKDATNATQNTAQNMKNSISNGVRSLDGNNNNYTATRTSTTSNTTPTLFGLNSTLWAWMIMAILGIVIVALVWYYGKQNEVSSKHSDNRY